MTIFQMTIFQMTIFQIKVDFQTESFNFHDLIPLGRIVYLPGSFTFSQDHLLFMILEFFKILWFKAKIVYR